MAAKRTFYAEVETVWHKDYQCDYYRGVVIDEEDCIVERCSLLESTYEKAKSDAETKIAASPLYSRQTTDEMKKKLNEYKERKRRKEILKTICIFENNGWMYIHDNGLYRYKYENQNSRTALFLSQENHPFLSAYIDRKGEEECSFYSSRVKNIYDVQRLPGNKIIWKIEEVIDIHERCNEDVQILVGYRRYNNFFKEYSKKVYQKEITIKKKYDGFKELMDRFEFYTKA